jgi:hypothetical protein
VTTTPPHSECRPRFANRIGLDGRAPLAQAKSSAKVSSFLEMSSGSVPRRALTRSALGSDFLSEALATEAVRVKPRLRGVSHQVAFFLALPLGVALTFEADTFRGRVAAIVFGASVAAMFGASGLYHRVTWSSARRRLWVRRLDHAGIFGLIAGTYAPFGLLVLRGDWRLVVLSIVWAGTALAVLLKITENPLRAGHPQALPKWSTSPQATTEVPDLQVLQADARTRTGPLHYE